MDIWISFWENKDDNFTFEYLIYQYAKQISTTQNYNKII